MISFYKIFYERLKSELEVVLGEKAKIKMDKALNRFFDETSETSKIEITKEKTPS